MELEELRGRCLTRGKLDGEFVARWMAGGGELVGMLSAG